jgi:hypothetical protein
LLGSNWVTRGPFLSSSCGGLLAEADEALGDRALHPNIWDQVRQQLREPPEHVLDAYEGDRRVLVERLNALLTELRRWIVVRQELAQE